MHYIHVDGHWFFQSNQVLMQSVSDNVADGDWHLVIISVLEDACTFYLDGIKLSTKYEDFFISS